MKDCANHTKVDAEKLHANLRGWAEAAKFEEVTCRNLGSANYFELRFKRGRNKECATAADAEKWLGYISRGMGCRIPSGDSVVSVNGEQIVAWFRWETTPVKLQAL